MFAFDVSGFLDARRHLGVAKSDDGDAQKETSHNERHERSHPPTTNSGGPAVRSKAGYEHFECTRWTSTKFGDLPLTVSRHGA